MDHADHFRRLDAWLLRHQSFWRARPFVQRSLAWEAEWPDLALALRSRTLEQAELDHRAPHQLELPAPFPELAAESRSLTSLADLSCDVPSIPEGLSSHIPGRKWQQIRHFAGATEACLEQPVEQWLDWCAGKGHLGRLLAWRSGLPVLCLERDDHLCRDGKALSDTWAVAADHQLADVLTSEAWSHLSRRHSAVALHACGDLHVALLRQGTAAGCKHLVVSPCCYNRIGSSAYQPLSSLARASSLALSRDDLGLPLQQTVTAGKRVRRLRDKSMAWRLAFDLWQRAARGVDDYFPTPSRPESALTGQMSVFCQDLAAHHRLVLPEPESWDELEARGWQRLAQVRNLELIQALFHRPLELWLLMDRALYLEEHGYRVQAGEFCAVSLTPRNLILLAERAF